jgi:hypothetical protein
VLSAHHFGARRAFQELASRRGTKAVATSEYTNSPR